MDAITCDYQEAYALSRRFPLRLRAAAKAAGFASLADVARAAGVSIETMRKYRTGARLPTCATLIQLAEVLDVPAGWLVGEGAVTTAARLRHAAELELRICAAARKCEGIEALAPAAQMPGCTDTR